mgnify:FL=1
MNILFDHQIFSSQRYGGISRYFYELVCGFDDIQDIEVKITLLISNNHYISEQIHTKHIDLLPNSRFRGRQRFFNLLNSPKSILQLNRQNFDIFHPTYYNPYFLNYIGNKPFVLTVYDMIHEKFNELFSSNDKTSQNKRLLVEKASKIIAISESTKKDLIELFGTEESKIEVIYLGSSMSPKSEISIGFEIPKNYILFVGLREGYKNFERFIKSVATILNDKEDLFVICVGGDEFRSGELKLFFDLNIENQILQYNLNDDNLPYFYKNALTFVFPSLYEGFGIPILESFACECPLICSNVSSLPEVAGKGACYFDPYSEESIKNAVLKVLEDANFREQLMLNAAKRLKFFSWKRTARQTKCVYEKVLA